MAKELNIEATIEEILRDLDKLETESAGAQVEIHRYRQMPQAPLAQQDIQETAMMQARAKAARHPEEEGEKIKEELRKELAEKMLEKVNEQLRKQASHIEPGVQREWFYVRGTQSVGPVSDSALQKMLTAGELPWSTLVWRRPFSDWRKAEETELVGDLAGPSAPPPIPAIPTPAPAATPQVKAGEAQSVVCVCGQAAKPGARFCAACGQSLPERAECAPQKPVVSAAKPASSPESKTSTCPACHQPNKPTARFCCACGKPMAVAAATKFCAACGHETAQEARFCRSCGASLTRSPTNLS